MPKSYEHLRLDISPRALEWIGDAVEARLAAGDSLGDSPVRTEASNFVNECRARLQHVMAGEPDISEPLPGHSDEAITLLKMVAANLKMRHELSADQCRAIEEWYDDALSSKPEGSALPSRQDTEEWLDE